MAMITPPPVAPPSATPVNFSLPPADLASGLASLAQARPNARGGTGMQAGMPYDRGRPQIMATIPSITGSGDASVFNCYNSYLSWSTAQQQFSSLVKNASASYVFPTFTQSTRVIVTMYTNTSVMTATRCDGVKFPPTSTETSISLTFNEPWVSTKKDFATPKPTCGIPEDKCQQAHDAYSTATYNYLSSVYSSHFAARKTDLPAGVNFDQINPPCTKPHTSCPPQTRIEKCKLLPSQVSVFYWPTSMADFCGDQDLVPATATIKGVPNTAVYSGMTVTSPSPLVIVRGIERHVQPPASLVDNESDIYFSPCGLHEDAKLIVDAKVMTTYRSSQISAGTFRQSGSWATRYSQTFVPHQFNFADLEKTQVPFYHTFRTGGSCPSPSPLAKGKSRPVPQCARIYTGNNNEYKPVLSMPNAVQGARADFAGCEYDMVHEHQLLYHPITASTIGFADTTLWGLEVTPGPRTSLIQPAVAIRFATPTPVAVPEIQPQQKPKAAEPSRG